MSGIFVCQSDMFVGTPVLTILICFDLFIYRKIATLTYRSGPEWEQRFHTKKVHDPNVKWPCYNCAEFQIEDYIRHQVS